MPASALATLAHCFLLTLTATTTTPASRAGKAMSTSSCTKCACAAAAAAASPPDRETLPKCVVPVDYRLRIAPDLDTFRFAGTEEVDLDVAEPTSSITFNAVELTVSAVTVATASQTLPAVSVVFDESKGTCTAVFGQAVPAGRATLRMAFGGALNDKLAGFYRAKQSAVPGETRPTYMAVTQFEPCDARRAFPCWDEPAAKATFRITLVVREGLTALSNMPVESEAAAPEGTGLVEYRFAQTPRMSTYLLALAVGNFDYVEDRTREGVLMRVYTQVGKKELGQFALDVSKWVLSYFGEFFGIDYPLPKCDLIAVPDFSFGAMENWGLITFRETALLIDDNKSSVASRQRVAYVVSHELAHQWFGNLVTMEWWSDLWLNEGFATYIGNYAVAKLFPQWDFWTDFVFTEVLRALELDSLASTHPIEVPIKSALEVNEIFDAISYSKGASVIRMLATFLGEEAFRKGLHTYLTRFTYKNTVTEDLWQAWRESSGVDVKALMGVWTKESGYPVLTVHSKSDTELELSQERFFARACSSASQVSMHDPWWVPVSLASSAEDLKMQLNFSSKTHAIKHQPCSDFWLKVNLGQTGVYRVKYDTELMSKLSSVVAGKLVPAVDRLGIQDDAFALAGSGQIPSSQALQLALAYENEDDCTVWTGLAGNLVKLMIVWRQEPTYDRLQTMVLKLFRPVAKNLGWDKKENEADLISKLRATVLRRLVLAGDADVRAEALKRFEASLANPSSLPSDQRGFVYVTAAKYGGPEGLDKLKSVFHKSDMQEQRVAVLSSLGATPDADSAYKILEWAAMSGEVRTQDYFLVVNSVSTYWPEVAWKFLKDKWSWLCDTYTKGQGLLPRIVSLSTTTLSSTEDLRDVESFFETHALVGAAMTIRQSVETIKIHNEWLTRSRDDVAEWLASQSF